MTIQECTDIYKASQFLGLKMTAVLIKNLIKPIGEIIKHRIVKDLQVTKYQCVQQSMGYERQQQD